MFARALLSSLLAKESGISGVLHGNKETKVRKTEENESRCALQRSAEKMFWSRVKRMH